MMEEALQKLTTLIFQLLNRLKEVREYDADKDLVLELQVTIEALRDIRFRLEELI